MKCTNRERSKGRAWRLRRRSYKANFPCSCLPRYRRRERRPQKTLLALPSWQLQNYRASSPLCYMVKAVLPILQMLRGQHNACDRCYMATQNTVNHIADSVASNAQLSHHLLCGFFFSFLLELFISLCVPFSSRVQWVFVTSFISLSPHVRNTFPMPNSVSGT